MSVKDKFNDYDCGAILASLQESELPQDLREKLTSLVSAVNEVKNPERRGPKNVPRNNPRNLDKYINAIIIFKILGKMSKWENEVTKLTEHVGNMVGMGTDNLKKVRRRDDDGDFDEHYWTTQDVYLPSHDLCIQQITKSIYEKYHYIYCDEVVALANTTSLVTEMIRKLARTNASSSR